MSAKKIIKGVSYGRVSTFDQAFFNDGTRREDGSPQMQKLKCQHYIDSVNMRGKGHYQISEHLSDDGFSGKNTKRPQFQKLVSMVKSGEIDFVIASDLTRLARNTFDFLEFFNLCTKHSVELMVIGFDVDTSSAIGKVLITIFATLAEFERSTTGERVKVNSLARLVSDGKINGASEVLGLDSCPDRKGHFIINSEEVKRVERILEIFLLTSSRAETLREIKRLNIRWKRGQEFTRNNFMMLFKSVNDRYKGLWPVNKTCEEGLEDIKHFVKLPHGPVLDTALLDRVEQKLKETKKKKRQTAKNHTYLLSTTLEHEDGSSFSGQPAKQRQYRYYFNRKNNIRIRCDEIEKPILKRLEEYLSNDDLLKSMINKSYIRSNEKIQDTRVRVAEIERDIKKLKQQETVLLNKVLSTPDLAGGELLKMLEGEMFHISSTTDSLNTELKALEALKDEMLAPISTDRLKKMIKSFVGQIEKTPSASHRGILEKIFHKIVIKSNNEIELVMCGEILGENKTTRSSSGGLNGGSNKT